jgi:hypothetical protein
MRIFRQCLWIRSVFSLGMIVGCFRAGAQSTINTLPSWNGSSNVFNFAAPPNETQTYGQTITSPVTGNILSSFSFEIEPVSGASVNVAAYVYAWDSVNDRATGPALYTSAPVTISGAASFQLVTFNTGALALTPGAQYVLFGSSTSLTGTGDLIWGGPQGIDPYAGGTLVYLNNTLTSEWTTQTWTQTYNGINDFAFKATFVPEPETYLLLGGGLLAIGLTGRYRRRVTARRV